MSGVVQCPAAVHPVRASGESRGITGLAARALFLSSLDIAEAYCTAITGRDERAAVPDRGCRRPACLLPCQRRHRTMPV
jgi:hypothetical protein